MERVSNRFALWLTIGRILSMLVVFAMPLVMTRVLSQSDYGVFSQYFTLYMALNVIFALGFHSNLFYFYPTGNEQERDEYVSNTLFLLLLMSVTSAVLLSTGFVKMHLYGESRLAEYAGLITLSIALSIPMNIVSPLLTVREDKWGAVFFPPAAAILRVGTVVIVALLYNDLMAIFQALVGYQLLILTWVLFYAFRHHKIRINIRKIRPQILYSVPFGLTVALQMFSNYFDKIVCIRYLDAMQYAIYGTAFLSIPGINQIYESLCQVNVVNMTKSYQEGDLAGVGGLYRDFVIKTLSFSTPVILAVSLFAEEIICFLYPTDYLPSAPYFRIYSLTFLTAMLGAGTVLRACGKTQYSLISFMISSVISLPSTYLLVKNYGADGAILGAVISMILPRFIQMIYEAKEVQSSLSEYLSWRGIGFILGVGCLLLLPLLVVKILFSPGIIVCILLSCLYVVASYYLYIRKDCFLLSKVQIEEKCRRLLTKRYDRSE